MNCACGPDQLQSVEKDEHESKSLEVSGELVLKLSKLDINAKPFVRRWTLSSQDVRRMTSDEKIECKGNPKRDPFESFRKHGQRIVCGSCIMSEGHVLLVKQRECSKWGFPKGSKEFNESKYACMVRELHEETGIHLHNQLNWDFIYSKTFFESTIYFFQIPTRITNLEPLDTAEIEQVKWVPIDELQKLSLNRITDFIKRNILLKFFLKIETSESCELSDGKYSQNKSTIKANVDVFDESDEKKVMGGELREDGHLSWVQVKS